MKKLFMGSFLVVCIGLACGYPSQDMIGYALEHPGGSQFGFSSVVVAAAFLCPLAGFVLLIRSYTRGLIRFHRRMASEGLSGVKGGAR